MALSLTEYNTSAAAAIAAGSKVEIAGAFFQFPSDETPTGWAAIVTATTAYIALTASGTAGSQVVNAGYVSTAPTWRDDLQGWYASAASSVRIVASVYKAEATSYYPKRIIETLNGSYKNHGVKIFISSGTFIVPNDVSIIWLTGCAAGGNGGNAAAGVFDAGGGGGGEIVWKKPFSVTSNSIIGVTIGSVGSNTSFGSTSFNYGKNGTDSTLAANGTGGSGGAAINGSEAGGRGGDGGNAGATTSFSGGGSASQGGGGGGGLGLFGYYLLSTAGAGPGGAGGSFGGGGGGGAAASNGGNGGYGSGGGGGGGASGLGGSGGAAVLIVEW